jgi:hypothetical protein
MQTHYDYIIWGASVKGIAKAISLKAEGKKVLLTNPFGFPGGKIAESLSCIFPKEAMDDGGELSLIKTSLRKQQYGLVELDDNEVLVYPEAAKRACWEVIEDNELEILFHLTPIQVSESEKGKQFEVFGREGTFVLNAGEVIDCSDNQSLENIGAGETGKQAWFNVNLFLTKPVSMSDKTLSISMQADTEIGQFISTFHYTDDIGNLDNSFNRVLNVITQTVWEKYGSRVLVLPVNPELER